MAETDAKKVSRVSLGAILHFIALLLVIVICIFPFYWMVASSFKQQPAILSSTPQFFFQPTLDNYLKAFSRFDIIKGLQNSLFVAFITMGLSVLLGTPAAFAIARFDFNGRKGVWFWFICSRILSPIVVALPFYLIASNLGILDNRWALIFIYLTFNVPLVVWVCCDQFRDIPKELDEAATLEGYNSFAIFWKIGLPFATPAIAVSAILTFISSWNEFLYALILTRKEAETAPVVATSLMSGYSLPWGEITAAGTLITLPVIVLGMIVARQLVRGLTHGAIK